VFCTNCGAENPLDAKFCMHCGRAIVRQQEPPPSVAPNKPVLPSAQIAHATASPLGRFEIRPRSRRNAVILGLFALMAVGGAFTAQENQSELEQVKEALGLASAAVAMWFAWRLWNRPVSVILHPDRIEYIQGVGRSFVPYADIESIGVKSMVGIKIVGLALKTSENYVNGMSDSLKRLNTAGLPFQRLTMPILQKIYFSFPLAGAISKGAAAATGSADFVAMLEEAGHANSIEDNLRIFRKHMGVEVWFNSFDLDRKPEAFAALLEDYRRAAENGGSSQIGDEGR
jgi:hypothetical protein